MPSRRRLEEEGYDADAIRQQFTQPMGEPEPMGGVAELPPGPQPSMPNLPAMDMNPTKPGGSGIAAPGAPAQEIGGQNDPRNQIANAYRSSLGREGSETEIASHLGKGSNLSQSLQNIAGSAEAQMRKPKMTAATPTAPGASAAGVGNTAAGIGPSGAVAGAAGGSAPNIGQEEATVGVARPKNYDVVEGADQLEWGDTARLSGFNTAEWGEGGTEGYHDNSVKNTFGKIATRYDPSPDGARQIVQDPDFKRMFPEAVLIDHPTDPKIQFFPDDAPVDVLASSGEGGWQWLPEDEAGGGGMAGGAGGFNPTSVEELQGGDILEQIKRQLAATAQGREPFLDDALSKEFA